MATVFERLGNIEYSKDNPQSKRKRKKTNTTQKTTQKILELLMEYPHITRKELAKRIKNITESGIKYHLKKLKLQGKIKRVGPDRGGYWEVIRKP